MPKASSIVYIGMNTVLPVSASGPFLPNSGTVLSLYYGGICSRADITLWRPVGGRRAWPLNPFFSIFIYCFKSYWSKSLSLWIKLSWLLLMWRDMFTLARSRLGIAVSWASCRYILLLSSSTLAISWVDVGLWPVLIGFLDALTPVVLECFSELAVDGLVWEFNLLLRTFDLISRLEEAFERALLLVDMFY